MDSKINDFFFTVYLSAYVCVHFYGWVNLIYGSMSFWILFTKLKHKHLFSSTYFCDKSDKFFAPSLVGAPQALLQSCLTFGAFSCIMEGLNKQQPALALSLLATKQSFVSNPHGVLPPFTLPLPYDLREGFSAFCKSLPKSSSSTCLWLLRKRKLQTAAVHLWFLIVFELSASLSCKFWWEESKGGWKREGSWLSNSPVF